MAAKVTCFSIISRNLILSSDFYEYNLRPTFLTFKDHFLSYCKGPNPFSSGSYFQHKNVDKTLSMM